MVFPKFSSTKTWRTSWPVNQWETLLRHLQFAVTMVKRPLYREFKPIYQWVVVSLLILAMGLVGCGDRPSAGRPTQLSSPASKRFYEQITEVSPPDTIQALHKKLDIYQPQVQLLSPKPGEVIEDTSVTVRFSVQDLPLFKDDALGMGPHLEVILDNQTSLDIYDVAQPVIFENLTPGTHTIRAFASRPWHESFKNAGAYAQVTFSVFTETLDNQPADEQPLLTYSRPNGAYGAEPIMLDFYLANAPLHLLARESDVDDIEDWNIRGTVNGQSFIFDTWEPIYLTGFATGLNWVKLELIDTKGNVINGPFNSTARLIDYAPNGQDPLSKLVRGELPLAEAMRLVDPTYEPPQPESEPEPELKSEPESELESEPEPDTPAPDNPEPVNPLIQDVPSAPDTAIDTEPDAIKPGNPAHQESISADSQSADEVEPLEPLTDPVLETGLEMPKDDVGGDEVGDWGQDADPSIGDAFPEADSDGAGDVDVEEDNLMPAIAPSSQLPDTDEADEKIEHAMDMTPLKDDEPLADGQTIDESQPSLSIDFSTQDPSPSADTQDGAIAPQPPKTLPPLSPPLPPYSVLLI